MDELDIGGMVDSVAESMPTSTVEEVEAPIVAPAGGEVAPTGEESPATAPVVEETPVPAPAAAAKAPPKTWRSEAVAEWDKLPPTIQDEVLKREEDIFRGIEEYKGRLVQAQPLMDAIAPYAQSLQQHNVDPATMVQSLLQAQYQLAFGSPQQKTAMLQKIASDYGIDWGSDAEMIDPKTSELEMRLQRMEQGRVMEIRERTAHEVNAFATEVGANGQPAHPYFDDLATDIAGLIKSGQAADLKSAYEKAIWLNPVTREKEVQRVQAAASAEAQRKAAEAYKAEAANVKTSAKAVTAGSAAGTMDDTMKETLKAINSRAA